MPQEQLLLSQIWEESEGFSRGWGIKVPEVCSETRRRAWGSLLSSYPSCPSALFPPSLLQSKFLSFFENLFELVGESELKGSPRLAPEAVPESPSTTL